MNAGAVRRMKHALIAVVLFGTAAALGGCSSLGDTLFPSLSGGDPRRAGREAQRVNIPPAPGEIASLPSVTPGAATGTFVGGKVAQLRGDLVSLQQSISAQNTRLQQVRANYTQNAQTYQGLIAAVNARLQVGTTPSNPILTQQWDQAQSQLNQFDGNLGVMNELSNRVAADAGMAGFLLESTRAAYGLAGAVDEDHRQLAILEDEVNRTVVLIDRLLNETSDDANRQTAYLAGERRNLGILALAIKSGEAFGTSLRNRAFATASPGGLTPPAPGPAAGNDGRRPLVVIRFDRTEVPYEQALYSAVAQVIDRRPNVAFDVVAVTPTAARSGQTAATSRRNADRVVRSLADMGLPSERIRITSATSTEARSSEVHIFVR